MAIGAIASSVATRRGAAVIALMVALAAALGVAIFRPDFLPNRGGGGPVGEALTNQVAKGVANVQALGSTVADILAGRSPGERLAGVLANLKHKRAPALHQRALPKIRRPVNPLGAIVAAPSAPLVVAPPAETPLYNVVNGTPTPVPVVAATPAPGEVPVVFPGFTPPPGGGGGFVTPPIVQVPPVTPPITPPTTPGVPEPSTWAMMLLGFAFIGQALRNRRRTSLPIAAS